MSSTVVALPERETVFLWGFASVNMWFCLFVGLGPGLSVSPATALGSIWVKKKKRSHHRYFNIERYTN